MNIPHNYCVLCGAMSNGTSHFCDSCDGVSHFYTLTALSNASIYCSNCGAILNKFLDGMQERERILCKGCTYAFAHPLAPACITEKSLHYIDRKLEQTTLPVHIEQAYRRLHAARAHACIL